LRQLVPSASLSDKNFDNFEGFGIFFAKTIKLVDAERDIRLEYAIEMIGR